MIKLSGFSSRQGFVRLFWLANILLAAVLCLALWASYQQHLRYAEERANNTTLTLGKSVSGIFEQIDVLLLALTHNLEHGRDHGKAEQVRFNELSRMMASNVRYLSRIAYTDAQGWIADNTGLPQGSAGVSLADRDYFQQLRAQPDIGLLISKPLLGRTSGRLVLVLARAYKNAAGKFAGVAFVSVELSVFSDLFAKLQLGEHSAVNLFTAKDYIHLARYPLPGKLPVMGQRLRVQTFIDLMEQGKPLVNVIETSSDGRERVYAIRKLEAWPFWIATGLSTQAELVPWRKQLYLGLMVMLIFSALTGIALRQQQRSWRRQEDALSMLGATLEATDNGILVVDSAGKVLHRNQRFLELWNIPPALADSTEDSALISVALEQLSNPQEFLNSTQQAYSNPEVEFFDTLHMQDGRVYERNSLPMRLDGKISGRVWSFRDISGRVQAEAAQAKLREQLSQATKMESIGHLTAGIAHDFNNMLGAIMGFTELSRHMLAEGKPEVISPYLQEVLKAGTRAKELIAQMLTFSRLSPEVKGEPAPVTTLTPVIKEVVALLRSSIPRTIDLNYRVDDENLQARIQPVHLHQILLNLGVNARDALGEYGKIDIELTRFHADNQLCSACRKLFSGEFAGITIRDSGSGIPDKIRDKIFDPFFTTKGVGKGTGMGLSVVHGLVHAQHGHIQLESGTGQGTAFSILLPLELVLMQDQVAEAVPETANIRGVRIMVVDDERVLTNMLHEILSMHGAHIIAYNDPIEALEGFIRQADNIDLVITDEAMPGMSGMHLAEKILKIRSDVPVILCTGYSEHATQENAAEKGLAGFFYKPVNMNELLRKIQALCAVPK